MAHECTFHRSTRLNEKLFEMIELRVAHSTLSGYFHVVLILVVFARIFLLQSKGS